MFICGVHLLGVHRGVDVGLDFVQGFLSYVSGRWTLVVVELQDACFSCKHTRRDDGGICLVTGWVPPTAEQVLDFRAQGADPSTTPGKVWKPPLVFQVDPSCSIEDCFANGVHDGCGKQAKKTALIETYRNL